MERFQSCQTFELPLHSQPNHLAFQLLHGEKIETLKGSFWDFPQSIRSFILSLQPAHLFYLERCGLARLPLLVEKEIQWSLLGAAVERFNPFTHTFFFNCGEMMILPEEVHEFFPVDPMTSRVGFSSIFGVLEELHRDEGEFLLFHLGVPLVMGPDKFLSLNQVAESMLPLMLSGTAEDIEKVSLAAFFIVAGVFIFSNGDFSLSPNALCWLEKCRKNRSCEITHVALAHLIEGLSMASIGGLFFGSPYLLQGWLYNHFPFVRNRDDSGFAPSFFLSAPRYSILNNHRGFWRRYFDLVDTQEPHPDFGMLERVQCPLRNEDECILIGVESFVVIPIQRCAAQLGFVQGIPPLPSFRPRITVRAVGSAADQSQIQNILMHWECYAPTRLILRSVSNDLARTRYMTWYAGFQEKLYIPFGDMAMTVVARQSSLEASGSEETSAESQPGMEGVRGNRSTILRRSRSASSSSSMPPPGRRRQPGPWQEQQMELGESSRPRKRRQIDDLMRDTQPPPDA